MFSDLTYKISALPNLPDLNADDGIDWAIEMIGLGHESPYLFMVASFSKPTNYFEIIPYITTALRELNIELKNGDKAIASYAYYYVLQISKGENIRNNLTRLYQFCQHMDYDKIVYDFYLLYWAWDQLDYEDIGNNHYWENASRQNIEEIVVNEAKKWVEKINRL